MPLKRHFAILPTKRPRAAAQAGLLQKALQKLSPREKRIVELRFGLNNQPECTQKQVADLLGISQSYISRLEKRIIKRLHKEMIFYPYCMRTISSACTRKWYACSRDKILPMKKGAIGRPFFCAVTLLRSVTDRLIGTQRACHSRQCAAA